MYLLILYMPLLSSILSIFFGKYLGKNGTSLLVIFCMFVTLILSFFIFFEVVLSNNVCILKLFKWIDVANLNIY
jgi:NADH:ubiquinone oxidoreductase subunit 5 (subunit L)/multisubunit Na+/H+ antiporter MnhA subunit